MVRFTVIFHSFIMSDLWFVPFLSSSSSASWPSLQRSGCLSTNTHHGPLSWATASGCRHSSVCPPTWSTTCSMLRAHSNRCRISEFSPNSVFLHLSRLLSWPTDISGTTKDCFWPFSFPCAARFYSLLWTHDWRSKKQGGGPGQRLARKKANRIGDQTRAHTHTLQWMCSLSRCCNWKVTGRHPSAALQHQKTNQSSNCVHQTGVLHNTL